MNRIISLLLLALVAATSCRKENEDPAPQAITFQLTEATLNGDAISPLPFYQLTLHFDAAGIPTIYEAQGSHASAPAPGQQGTWMQNGTQLTFTSQDGSESHQVQVSGAEVSVLSSSVELSWDLGKTEIAWEQVGDYVYTLQRME
ncbi:MAG: hypothetical protein AAF992_02045 [Bacteroidota bacterium]